MSLPIPLQGTESAKDAIARVKNPHDAMIDLQLAKPGITQNELAKCLGYTVPWVSRVVNSDAYKARLAQRKQEIVDPILADTIEERFRGVVSQSLEIVANKLEATQSAELALKALDIGTKALGYGARDRGPTVQNSFVVHLPQKAESAQAWASQHAPGGQGGGVVDVEVRVDLPETSGEEN